METYLLIKECLGQDISSQILERSTQIAIKEYFNQIPQFHFDLREIKPRWEKGCSVQFLNLKYYMSIIYGKKGQIKFCLYEYMLFDELRDQRIRENHKIIEINTKDMIDELSQLIWKFIIRDKYYD